MRALRREAGQTIVLMVVALVGLIGMVGFAVDIGYAYYTQRALQASADAAALAGAQQLPDGNAAIATASEFGTQGAGKNRLVNVGSVDENVFTKCIRSIPGCSPVNAVVVEESAHASTFFARVLGINTFDVRVVSTACSPCGTRPFDVMLVIDRTGSMCMDSSGRSDPSCTDLNNAKEGMREFLTSMDGNSTMVGLGLFPPARSVGSRCSSPNSDNYDRRDAAYTVVPLSRGYSSRGVLNTSSNLVQTINCIRGGGTTAYANALEEAQDELERNGRPDVQDVIIFFSDGAANTGPSYYSSSSPYRRQPCHQGIWSADAAKSRGTLIYSIGYDLDGDDGAGGSFNRCERDGGGAESPAITANQALEQIASLVDGSRKFYAQPNPGDLTRIFGDISGDLMEGTSALIDNNAE
jgi:Flp pilus assembly protein TadG